MIATTLVMLVWTASGAEKIPPVTALSVAVLGTLHGFL